MDTRLYSVFSSHPALAAHLMLAHKRIDHTVVQLVPGLHAAVLRGHGFSRGTVPALILGGRRVEGTREIARALEEAVPEPPLFPADPGKRARVVEAEAWGDEVLQVFPRRLFNTFTPTDRAARRVMTEQAGLPFPGLLAAIGGPVAWNVARKHDATGREAVARLFPTLPLLLDRAEALLDEGTIGSAEANAADFQIATSLRLLLAFGDLRPLIADRRAIRYAAKLIPDYPMQVPAGLIPPEWISAFEDTGGAGGDDAPAAQA